MPDEQARAEVVSVLELTNGNVVRAAHALGISRRQFYRYLWQIDGLWNETDRVRAKAMADFIAARRRLGVHSDPWKTE